jgi:hypothetical protein
VARRPSYGGGRDGGGEAATLGGSGDRGCKNKDLIVNLSLYLTPHKSLCGENPPIPPTTSDLHVVYELD